MLALGLALNRGGAGYFKPFKETVICREDRLVDQDAYLMKRLLGSDLDEEVLCPFLYDLRRPVKMDAIKQAYAKANEGQDLMLVEGTRDITTGYMNDLSGMAIAEALHCPVLLISAADPMDLERLAMLRRLLMMYKAPFAGAVINNDDGTAADLLRKRGIEVIGSIPPIRELRHYTVREVQEVTHAEVVVGIEHLDRVVEQAVVGAMSPDTALRMMRRIGKKALITGGDRPDLQLAALETDTSCIVLTGGMYPERIVIAKAYEAKVPLLLTANDTMRTVELIEHLIARIAPEDEGKIALIRKAVKENVDTAGLF
jgi:BioD-like phosphotransacetylase family protein